MFDIFLYPGFESTFIEVTHSSRLFFAYFLAPQAEAPLTSDTCTYAETFASRSLQGNHVG